MLFKLGLTRLGIYVSPRSWEKARVIIAAMLISLLQGRVSLEVSRLVNFYQYVKFELDCGVYRRELRQHHNW